MEKTFKSIAGTFANTQACGLPLLLALYFAWGTEPFPGWTDPEQEAINSDGWTVETIAYEIKNTYNVELDESQIGKLMAAITIVNQPSRFYTNLPDFIDLSNALNGDTLDPAVFDPVSAMEAAWAIYEALLIEVIMMEPSDKPEDQIPEFSQEIRGYLGAILDQEGITNPPDILRLAEHNPNRLSEVMADFSDDPAMFAAINETEEQKSKAITTELKGRLRLVFDQLAHLLNTDVPTVLKEFGIKDIQALTA